jgi:hypothetical protein
VTAFLFLLLFIAIIALIIWLISKNRQITAQRNQQFSVLARHAGWRFAVNPQYTSIVAGPQSLNTRDQDSDIQFTIDGSRETIAWRMWYDTDLRSRTDSASSGPRRQYRVESGHIVGAIERAFSAIASAVTGADEHNSRQAFFKRAVELRGSSPEFQKAFVVLVGPQVRQDWLDDGLQSLLLHWPKGVGRTSSSGVALEMRFGTEGLHVAMQQPSFDDWKFWEQFGRLGETLALRLAAKS